MNRRNPDARSPTPPSRVVKSTYGGNLFTHEDIEYLKKYIDYCVAQGLVLSLREICERVAVKVCVACRSNTIPMMKVLTRPLITRMCAPCYRDISNVGHSFYSWRRYCNKHQIRLGGYAMNNGTSDDGEAGDGIVPPHAVTAGPSSNSIVNIRERVRVGLGNEERSRSPTPPRALFRSTTGKGVAFTDEDIAFLIKLLDHKKKSVVIHVELMAIFNAFAQISR